MCPSFVSVNASCARGPDDPHVNPIGGGLNPAGGHLGPFDAHVNPIGGGLGRLPTMPPIGFSCALKGSCCQQRGPAASTATTTNTTAPKTQTTSTTTPRFSAFFTEVVCTLGTTPPQTVISPPPNGGNGVIRTTTRRRHANSQPLMLQNPHRNQHGGHQRDRTALAPRPDPVPGQPGTRTREPGAAPQGRQGLRTASISSTGQTPPRHTPRRTPG